MGKALLQPIRGILWYLRELSGDSAYDHYLAHERSAHPGNQPMDRGEFYRRRQDEKYMNPGSRCP